MFFGTKPLSLTVSEEFNGECDAMVDMTLNDLYAKVISNHRGLSVLLTGFITLKEFIKN